MGDDGRLGREYILPNRPVIDNQLIAAGIRLAKVLNDALANYRPTLGGNEDGKLFEIHRRHRGPGAVGAE